MSRLGDWLEHRVGWRKLMHEGLDEPIPGRSRWAYVFGSGLLFIFINQAVTGMFLSLYYVPSATDAHKTVEFIQKQVTAGAFIRSLHAYGSSAMVVIVLLHLCQTYLYGAYKNKRELLWLAGCTLFLLVLGMSFTGYLLPWDQKAYAATAVATNIVSEVPFVGDALKTFLRGGTEMGTLTISRFFALHVFMIPLAIGLMVVAHVFLFRKAGAAGPPVVEEVRRQLPVEPFFPRQVLKDFLFGIVVIVVLGGLAITHPTTIGPMANPSDPTYLPRPEWYYIPVFQWLKYWHGPLTVVGVVLLPALVFLLLFALPFIDRSPERRPWRRPISVGGLLAVFIGLIALGARSSSDDHRDPSVHAKLVAQEQAERRFAEQPFEPRLVGTPAVLVRKLTQREAKGSLLFDSEMCIGCHGPEGKGGEDLFALPNIDAMLPGDDQLEQLLRHPNKQMHEGGMEPVTLGGEDLAALTAYLRFVTRGR
ncbi:MAG: cytochrome b N-terminal domain-containing protein [Polyangia bacterium]